MVKLPTNFRFRHVAAKGTAKCPSCNSILSSSQSWNRHLSACSFFKQEFPEVIFQHQIPPTPPAIESLPSSDLFSLPSVPSLPLIETTTSSSAPISSPSSSRSLPTTTSSATSSSAAASSTLYSASSFASSSASSTAPSLKKVKKPFAEASLKTQKDRLRSLGNKFVQMCKEESLFPASIDIPPFKLIVRNPTQPNQPTLLAQNTVAAMDHSSISKRGYSSLAAAQPDMLRTYEIEDERARENREFEALAPKMPLGETGYWRRLRDLLPLVLPAYKVPEEATVKVKISGDGRLCGRRRHQTMMTFSVLSAGAVSCSPEHHYTLALWKGQEDYEDFHQLLQGLFNDLKEVQKNGIEVGGVHRRVELYLSGDWKFLALVLGITSPSARKGFCIWCLAQSDAIAGSDSFVLRDMQQVLEEFRKGHCKIPGQDRPPLIDFIPFERIIIDPLHCFLRISDKLIALMLEEALERQGGICGQCRAGTKRLCVADKCVCPCHIQVTEVIRGEMTRIGIPRFEFFESKTKKKGDLDWTSLQGDENMTVLKNFNLNTLFSPERSQTIGSLWDNYLIINRSLHASLEELQGHLRVVIPKNALRGLGVPLHLDQISPAITEWKASFLKVSHGAPADLQFNRGLYLESDLTPYLHALCAHVSEQLRLCARKGLALAWFSASAQEKKNHLQVNFFFSKTFKGGLAESEASASTMDAEGRLILRISKNPNLLKESHFNLHQLLTSPTFTKVYISQK